MQTMQFLTLRDIEAQTGLSLHTMRRWIKLGVVPFKLKKLPNGRLYTTEEWLWDGLNRLPDHGMKTATEAHGQPIGNAGERTGERRA